MSLKYAILGFLGYAPFSGYDLKKAFDVSIQHFWPADQSQIYRTLATLEEEGWVEMELVQQDNRPDKKVYHITQAGREELHCWLSAPPPLEQVRRASLIQVFFAGRLSDEEIIIMFERKAENLRELLEKYDKIPQKSAVYAETLDSPREVFFWMLTLEHGIKVTQAQLEWVESVIQRFENRDLKTRNIPPVKGSKQKESK